MIVQCLSCSWGQNSVPGLQAFSQMGIQWMATYWRKSFYSLYIALQIVQFNRPYIAHFGHLLFKSRLKSLLDKVQIWTTYHNATIIFKARVKLSRCHKSPNDWDNWHFSAVLYELIHTVWWSLLAHSRSRMAGVLPQGKAHHILCMIVRYINMYLFNIY